MTASAYLAAQADLLIAARLMERLPLERMADVLEAAESCGGELVDARGFPVPVNVALVRGLLGAAVVARQAVRQELFGQRVIIERKEMGREGSPRDGNPRASQQVA